MVVIVSWAIGNNSVYFAQKRWLICDCDEFLSTLLSLVGILWLSFIKTNFTRITNTRVSDLHIVHLVCCNSELYFK